MKIKYLRILFLLSIAFIWQSYWQIPNLAEARNDKQQRAFQQAFIEQQKALKEELDFLSNQDLSLGFEKTLSKADFAKLSHSFFLLEDERLVFWSDDLIAFNPQQLASKLQLLRLGNGWYLKQSKGLGEKTLVGLSLIQHQYAHQNNYLKNDFPEELRFDRVQGITLDSLEGPPIYDHNGERLFFLKMDQKENYPMHASILQGLLALFGCVLFFFALSLLPIAPKYRSGLLILFLIGFRLLFLWALPIHWFTLDLFDPSYFAISNAIPSLGDFLLYCIFFFYAAFQLKSIFSENRNPVLFVLLAILSVFFSIWTLELIQLCVANSALSFNLNNLFALNYMSFICFVAFGLLLFSNLILVQCLLSMQSFSIKLCSGIILGVSLIFSLISVFPALNWWVYFWIILPYWIGALILKKQNSSLGIVALLLVLSAITSAQLSRGIQNQEHLVRELYIQKLAEEKDLLAEYLFQGILENSKKDSVLTTLRSEEIDRLDAYLRENYFTGYWDKYTIGIIPCTIADSLYTNPGNYRISCADYYQERIHFEGNSTQTENLHQLRNFAGRIDYIAVLDLGKENQKITVFIEMSASILNQNEGYPELLIDNRVKPDLIDLSQYSFAVYDGEELIMKAGNYNYSTHNRVPELGESAIYKYESENHEHLVYQKDAYTSIILSKEIEGKYALFTALAYLTVFFSALYVVFSLLFPSFPFRFHFQVNDFSSRIQFFLIGSLLAALILFSVGTGYYIKKQNEEKNVKNIAEKLRSINIEMENKIGGEEVLTDSLNSYISLLMVKFSNVFYADINLYDTSGILYASSRPEIYAKGLKGNRLNPQAFSGLIQNEKAEWLQKERIGSLNYLSTYIPFKNDKNEVLAYLNLPYFAKHNELEKEISSFLVSTINIYVVIFVLALLVSILLINQLSKPLLMIRKQLASIKLGSELELIEWRSDDEIGSLVQEYNRMIVELSESADRLAQSEREGAWREMAKQVAHEIKNPLTPMKLSIQYLQLAFEQGAEDIDEKVKRTSQTLIEQIETLANIANEFSNFAKMPEQQLGELNLVAIINSASDLFAFPKAGKLLVHSSLEKAPILADRDQLLRLFNNLIKNSFQAAVPERDLEIEITLETEGEGFAVAIKDNGCGIPASQLDRIFEPNFTTKTGGTGLGLAMTKNIMTNLGGSIEINSEEGVGTTFSLYFPKAKQ